MATLSACQDSYSTAHPADTLPGGRKVQNEQPAVLEQGKPIDRKLAGGEAHSYQLTLASGQYVHLIVVQRGIDVLFTVFGPDSKKLIEVDSPNGPQGLEQISLLVGTPGSYRLEVRSFEKQATPGRYELRIEQLRPATEQDKSRAAAQLAYMQGTELLQRGTTESLKGSVARFEESLSLWRTVGDQSREAETLGYVSRAYFEVGDLKRSLDFYEQALSLYHAINYTAGEATVLNDIGAIHNTMGDRRKALEYYKRSLAVAEVLDDRIGQAITFQNMAIVYRYLGESQTALDYNEKALALHRAVGNQREEANTLLNIGALYSSLGEYQRALDYYNQSLPLQRAVGNKREEATVLGNTGAVYQALGDDRKAFDYYNQAVTLAKSTGGRSVATWLNNMGAVLQNLGEHQKAFDHFSQALALYEASSNLQGKALALNNIGMHYKAIGEYQKALDYYNQALTLRRAMGDPGAVAWTLFNIARLERDRGNLIEARSYIEQTLSAVDSMRTNVGSQQLRASFFASVRKYHEFNIDLLMRLNKQHPSEGFDTRALQASEKGRARSLLELLTEARANIRQGVDPALIERERSLQQLISEKAAGQMRLLSGKHTEVQAAAAAKEIDTLTAEYEQVQTQIRRTSPRYAALTQAVPLGLKEIQSEVLDDETLLLEYALGEEKSFLWAVTPSSIKGFELPKRAEIDRAAGRVYELLIARNQTIPKETPEQRRQRLDQAEADYPKAAATLSQMLLGPIASELGNKRLLIVSDGILQYVPFAALPGPTARDLRPLVVDNEIVNMPSASVVAVLRQETANRKPATRTLAVLADPVFSKDDPRVSLSGKSQPAAVEETSIVAEAKRSAGESGLADLVRLRFSRQEADEITRLAADKLKLEALDFAASRALATSEEIGQYRIVHFAAHGLINNLHPELSGIVLSLVDDQGRPQNGFLRLYDIYNLKLGADLVVLSACQTALGKEVKGEGLIGLTRGFMYAGAPRVVASLWRIDDRVTAELMKRFYQGMLEQGLRPAAALRAAQVSMWKDKRWQSPHYWAAFTFQGEWK